MGFHPAHRKTKHGRSRVSYYCYLLPPRPALRDPIGPGVSGLSTLQGGRPSLSSIACRSLAIASPCVANHLSSEDAFRNLVAQLNIIVPLNRSDETEIATSRYIAFVLVSCFIASSFAPCTLHPYPTLQPQTRNPASAGFSIWPVC